MEYVYSALLLHSAKKEVSEAHIAGVLKAAGIEADHAKIKGLLSALKDVNIDEAVQKAAMPVAVAAVAAPQANTDEKDAKEKAQEDAKSEEAAAEGLSSLFG